MVGPRCLLTCLNKGEPVPELPYPMFTAAMKDCVVTSTGFGKEKKKEVQLKVERMGGIYSNAFHDAVTHLVAEVSTILPTRNRTSSPKNTDLTQDCLVYFLAGPCKPDPPR